MIAARLARSDRPKNDSSFSYRPYRTGLVSASRIRPRSVRCFGVFKQFHRSLFERVRPQYAVRLEEDYKGVSKKQATQGRYPPLYGAKQRDGRVAQKVSSYCVIFVINEISSIGVCVNSSSRTSLVDARMPLIATANTSSACEIGHRRGDETSRAPCQSVAVSGHRKPSGRLGGLTRVGSRSVENRIIYAGSVDARKFPPAVRALLCDRGGH